jgi:hypothetical protein
MQNAEEVPLGELSLLGYDAHKLGFDHQPEAPLAPGDVVHVGLYWRAERQPVGDWQMTLALAGPDGVTTASISGAPVTSYPTSRWQAGDVWRGLFNLVIPSAGPGGHYRLRLQLLSPGGEPAQVLLSLPLQVEP